MSVVNYVMRLKEEKVVSNNAAEDLVNKPCFPIKNNENSAIIQFDTPEKTTATIKGNDSVLGGKDLVVSVPAGRSFCLLNVGPYVQVSGPNKGTIRIESDNYSVTANLITLPW